MRLSQSNKILMYDAVNTYLMDYPVLLNSIPEFFLSFKDFGERVKAVKAMEVVRQGATDGKTDAKYAAEDALINAAINIASSLTTYACKKNLPELKSIANVSTRKLDRMKEVDLIAKCTQIYNEVKKIPAADLTSFGLTQEETEDLKSRTEAYSTTSGKRDSSLAERVGTGVSIIDMLNEIDDILDNELDKFVNKFIEKEKTFYEGYYAARNIKDLGKHHNSKETTQTPSTTTTTTPSA